MDDSSTEFNIAEILAEVRKPDFMPVERELTKNESEQNSDDAESGEVDVAVNPAAPGIPPVTKPRERKPEPPVEVYVLPENPTKVDLAMSILSNVQKEFGTIGLTKPIAKPPEPVPSQKKFRSGDIIHNRLLETPAASGKKGDYLGKVTAEQRRNEKRKERKKLAREKAIASQRKTEEEDAKYIYDAFYSSEPESGSDEDTTKRLGPIVEQAKAEVEKLEAQDAEQSVEEAEDYFPENDAQITPEDVHYRYAARADNLRARTLAAVTVSLVMIYITLAVSFGWSLPSVFFDSSITLTGALAIGQLIITVLGIDVVITGIYDVLKFKPGAESLVVLSGMAAFADAANTMLLGETLYGMPYSLTASVALIFAMYGTRLGKSAYNKMLKTIAPFGKETLAIYAEWEKVDNGLVLSKSVGSTEGFLFKATRSDCSEILFGKIGPLLMLAAPVLAGISAIGTGRTEAFLRIWAAITCGAAAFSPLLAFNLPFNLASKRLSSTNTALAAWEGAEDISGTVGLIIKDNDLFKTSALRLSSFKVAQNFSVEQVVLYTASMIIHSGSGLTKIFSELLEEYGLAPAGISGFVTHEAGGLSAVIGGDKVYFGSEAFMRLKNIVLDEVPTKIGGAVFLSINGVAAGVFIVQYAPSEKVQKALLRMSKYKISPLLATRDVNITPTMLRSKFKLDLQNLEFPPYDERYALSDDSMETKAKPSALMSQDSLSAFADIAEAGKWLYNRAKFGTNMSALSSVIGAFAMFFLCHSGAFVAASPVKALLFHFILTVVVMFRSSL